MTVTLANLQAYYALEASSGTRVDSHNSYDLSPINAPGNNPGIVGNALQNVRASAQGLKYGTSVLPAAFTNGVSCSAWVYCDSLPGAVAYITGSWVNLVNSRWLLWLTGANRFSFQVSDGVTSTAVVGTSLVPSTATWYHLVGVWTPGATVELYINEVNHFSTPTTVAALGAGGVAVFGVGMRAWDGTQNLDGRIDEDSVWDDIVDASQVGQLFNSGAGLSYAGTRALFDVTVTPSTSTAIAKTSGPIAVVTPAACGVRVVQPFAGDYQLYFVDPTDGSPIDLVPISPRIHSLKYNLKLNDISEIRFTVDATDRLVERIIDTEDVLCDVMRRNTKNGDFETEKTFFIRYQDLFEEDNRRQSVIFAGVSVEDLLRRRLIIPDDDLLGAAGFSTKSGLPDLVMIQYVRDQCIVPALNSARVFPEFYLAPFTPDSVHMTYQRVNQQNNLLEVLQDIANTSNMDFEIYRTEGRRLEFLAHHIGQDFTTTRNEFQGRPFVLFSDRRANIQEPRLTYDRRTEATYMFVAGNGIEEDRIYVPQPSTRMLASPYNRIEAVIDSRDDDTIDQMLATASAEIQQQLGKWVFEWKVAFGQAQTRYNVDWSLGDRVTAEYQDVLQNFRLVEMEVEVKDSGEKLTPNFQQEL